jgi:hypothetical protein
VWAPGVGIMAANKDGSYHIVSGTSISSAIHSSAVAFQIGLEFSVSDPNQYLSSVRYNEVINIPNLDKLHAGWREHILTLEGNYVNSTNRITSIMSKPEVLQIIAFDLYETKTVGQPIGEVVFLNMFIESYNLEQPLPTGLQFIDGFIDGVVDSNYLEGQDYKLFSTRCNFTTILGETGFSEIRLLIKKDSEFDVTLLDDPEVVVHLQAGPNCPNGFACFTDCTAPQKGVQCRWPGFPNVCACF